MSEYRGATPWNTVGTQVYQDGLYLYRVAYLEPRPIAEPIIPVERPAEAA